MSYLTMGDGVKLHVKDSGSGETLIFCHGLNSSCDANEDFYAMFRDDFRVIVYDQRGHGLSESSIHMNVKRLGCDLHEIITLLDLTEVTLIGHSMGAATIYSYTDRFGCENIKRIVASDMSPYMRNDGWGGGINKGQWSDEDFLSDLDRIFDDVGYGAYHIAKNIMNPDVPLSENVIESYRENTNPLTMASLWYSLFRSDQRRAISKITVPFLYLMPENPLYSMEAVDFIKNNVNGPFELENGFSKTTHALWREMPREVSDVVKKFISKYR